MPLSMANWTSQEDFDQREGSVDRLNKGSHKRVFWVDTDSPYWGSKSVIDYVIGTYDVPILRAYSVGTSGTDDWYAADSTSGVATIRAVCDGVDGRRWKVEVDYAPLDPREQDNPLDVAPEVEYDFAQFERICDVDADGFQVTNSAGDYFDPPIVRDDSRPVLKVSVNLKTFDPAWADTYRDGVNESPWLDRPERTVKVAAIRGKRASHPSVPGDHLYWQVYMEFHVNPDTWDVDPLDQGLYYRDASDHRLPVLDSNGMPVTAPQLLDGDGAPLEVGGDAQYMHYEVYKKFDFAAVFGFGG